MAEKDKEYDPTLEAEKEDIEEIPLEEPPLEEIPLEDVPQEEPPLEEIPLEEPPLEETPWEDDTEDSGKSARDETRGGFFDYFFSDEKNENDTQEQEENVEREPEDRSDRRREAQQEREESGPQRVKKEQKAPEADTGRRESLFTRFGRWAQENLPEWAYKGFWGFVRLVGKTIRMIVFGEDSVTRDAAQSFERTMDAERYKAEKASREDHASKDAKEHAKETAEEAQTAQKAKEKEEPSKEADEKERDKEVQEAIEKTGHKVVEDPALKDTDILKLSRQLPDGSTKDCYIRKSDLAELSDKEIQQKVREAARLSGAQRYLNNHNLTLAAVGKDHFIVERPGGPSFSFENGMMKDKLSEVVKEFKEKEAQTPAHMEPVSEDMQIPVTEATLHDVLSNGAGQPAPQAPDQVIVGGDTEIPEIKFTTTEELNAQPYPELAHAGFLASKPDEVGVVRVEDPSGTVYHFMQADSRLKNPEIMQQTFTAMQRMELPQEAVCPEVPNDFHKVINNSMVDLLRENHLAMAADENGDAVYVFERNKDGSINNEKSWTLSQSSLSLGDATDLKKIIYEIDQKEQISQMKDHPEGNMIADDVQAAAKAVGIVSAMCSEVYRFEDGEMTAVAQTELTKEKDMVRSNIYLDMENAHSLSDLAVKLELSYADRNSSVDTHDYSESLKEAASGLSSDDQGLHMRSEIESSLKEPSDEIDHCIGMTMVSAEEDSPEIEEIPMPEPSRDQEMDDLQEIDESELDEIPPYDYDDVSL